MNLIRQAHNHHIPVHVATSMLLAGLYLVLFGLVGFVSPLCASVFLDASHDGALPWPQRMLEYLSPMWTVPFAVVIAVILLSKSRLLGSKQSQAVDAAAFILALLVFACWVWAVYGPGSGPLMGG